MEHPSYDPSKENIIFFHGFHDKPSTKTTKVFTSAHLNALKYNVITLDWSESASGTYIGAIVRSRLLGSRLADELLDTFPSESGALNVHLIGHSLGGQLAGLIGYYVQQSTNQETKVKRTTGLDPAGPGFFGNLFLHHLSDSDAQFVDIIHTDSGYLGLGYPASAGHVDFWPNGGTRSQPRCSGYSSFSPFGRLCSHIYAVELYAESVESSSAFVAVAAADWNSFKNGIVSETERAVMGADCNSNARGNYYLQTNSHSPYGRNEAGAIYDPNLN